MKTIQAFWLFLLLTSIELSTAIAQVIVLAPASADHTFKFGLKTNIPTTALSTLLSPLISTSPPAYYIVFINTGDGHYFIGDYKKNANGSTDLSKFTYTYPTLSAQATYYPYAEFVEVYDDGNPPGRSVIGIANSSYLSALPVTATATLETPISQALKLSSVRKIVRNHKNTYMVTFRNTNLIGNRLNHVVSFTYDERIFNVDPLFTSTSSSNPGMIATVLPASQPNLRTLTVKILTLAAGKQVNIFFPLITKGTAIIGASVTGPSVGLMDATNHVISSIPSSEMFVDKAHDPNLKTPFITTVAATGNWIEYRIDFQNDGPADATHIHITDELDNYLADNMPSITGASVNTSLVRTTKIGPRVWQWNLDNIVLMGTSNPAYTVEQAKGFIQFKVRVDRISSCQSIVNRARIVFECNPPVYTNFAYTRIPCNGAAVDSCQEEISNYWLPIISNVQPGATLDHLLDANLSNSWSNSSVFSCKWYPATQLTLPLDPATGVKMAQPETYVLVAARACQRNIVYVTVSPGGRTDDSAILVGDAPGDCQANLNVGGGTPPYKYVWTWYQGPMQKGGIQLPPLNLTGKTNVQVTVTDSLGCTAVFSPWPGNCPIGPHVPRSLVIVGAAAAGAAALYALRRKKLA